MSAKLYRRIGIVVPDQSGIVIYMVAFPSNEVLKASAQFWRDPPVLLFTAQMPFADIVRVITRLVQVMGNGRLIHGERIPFPVTPVWLGY